MLVAFLTLMPLFVALNWSFILLNTSKHNKAKKVLGFFMLDGFVLFATHFVYYNNFKSVYLIFDVLFHFCSLSIFPLYYLYIRVLTDSVVITFKQWLMFLPAIVIALFVAIVYLVMPHSQQLLYFNDYLFSEHDFFAAPLLIKIQLSLTHLMQVIYFIQIIYSSIKISKYSTIYNSNIENFYSNIEDKSIEWHKPILYSFLAISVFSIIYNFLGRSFFCSSALELALPSVTYSVLLFVFGYLGNLQNYNITNFNSDQSAASESKPVLFVQAEIETDVSNNVSNLHTLIQAINKLFESDKMYLNSDFKLTDIAERLNTNRTYISNAINANCKCSFNVFVNKFRIEHAKNILANPDFNLYSLDHIAGLCGFANLHTFMRVFKEFENTTPGKFRMSSQKSNQCI